jgi:hypothetical protein
MKVDERDISGVSGRLAGVKNSREVIEITSQFSRSGFVRKEAFPVCGSDCGHGLGLQKQQRRRRCVC